MNITISFGPWPDERTYDWPNGKGGQLWRRGFSIRWAKALDEQVAFSLTVRIRVNGMEIEQGLTIRELPDGR